MYQPNKNHKKANDAVFSYRLNKDIAGEASKLLRDRYEMKLGRFIKNCVEQFVIDESKRTVDHPNQGKMDLKGE